MTRKYDENLFRSPSTMSSGHISALQDGASGVSVPDLKRLSKEPGFFPVPRKDATAPASKEAKEGAMATFYEKQAMQTDERDSGAKAAAHPAKSKAQQGPVDRALQMLTPKKNKQR